jgi:hypothetical protein
MSATIKRIELILTPTRPGLPLVEFADYIIDSYDTGVYEYSTAEGDELRHVFYGRDEQPVVRWFREQTGSHGTAFPATLAATVTTLSLTQWKTLSEEWGLDPDFFSRSTVEGEE